MCKADLGLESNWLFGKLLARINIRDSILVELCLPKLEQVEILIDSCSGQLVITRRRSEPSGNWIGVNLPKWQTFVWDFKQARQMA